MENPFVYGEVVPAAAFVDRVDELRRLSGDLASGQKVFLISPRRYGKSSLISRALASLERDGVLAVQVTVSSYSSYIAFLEGYARAVLSATTRWERAASWIREALGASRPEVRLEPEADTRLKRALAPVLAANPGKSGVFALANGLDAFAARALLADAAERTLDVQYYIWHNDTSGGLLFDALRRAADRGVHVRLLLDDHNTSGLDAMLAALDHHPNLEVRLFNPFKRPGRLLGYLVDFSRLNRRMHNKSFTADNQATIVGGRNVADEYFGVSSSRAFVDLDVLAVGPAAQDVSEDFDRYWACESSYPAARILPSSDAGKLARVSDALAEIPRTAEATPYLRAVAERQFSREMVDGTISFEWAVTHMLSDDPAKVVNRASESSLLWPQLKKALGPPRNSLRLVSPYFVPTQAGVDLFAGLTREGVQVRVLTNSLEATDISIVHAGYAKRRRALLDAGVQLYEMRRELAGKSVRGTGLLGSSHSSLHAKTFSVDGQRVFVGSFNFDPRSARLNTELGLVIESQPLARYLTDSAERGVYAHAYLVRLSEKGSLEWIDHTDGGNVVHTMEPGTSWPRRVWVRILSWLPIEWLL